MLAFTAGVAVGIVLAVVAAVIVLRCPTSERTEAPRYFAVGADRLHDSSVNHSAAPSDWQPLFRPNN